MSKHPSLPSRFRDLEHDFLSFFEQFKSLLGPNDNFFLLAIILENGQVTARLSGPRHLSAHEKMHIAVFKEKLEAKGTALLQTMLAQSPGLGNYKNFSIFFKMLQKHQSRMQSKRPRYFWKIGIDDYENPSVSNTQKSLLFRLQQITRAVRGVTVGESIYALSFSNYKIKADNAEDAFRLYTTMIQHVLGREPNAKSQAFIAANTQ